jgi:hypothetical protein
MTKYAKMKQAEARKRASQRFQSPDQAKRRAVARNWSNSRKLSNKFRRM